MYQDVQLYARNGAIIATVSVMMSGVMYPDVVQWGARIFALQGGRYVEATYWAVQP